MPIEIKELHIKINVDEGANTGNNQQTNVSEGNGKEVIISACVEEIMRILEKQKER